MYSFRVVPLQLLEEQMKERGKSFNNPSTRALGYDDDDGFLEF